MGISKQNLRNIIHGKIVQIIITSLAGLEGVLALSVLLLEIEKLQSKDPLKVRSFELAKLCIEYINLGIVSLFIVETFTKLWAFGIMLYLRSVFESIDALVVFVSFAVDMYLVVTETQEHAFLFHSNEDALPILTHEKSDNETQGIKALPEAAGFLVLFRLWRIVHIINAITVSVSAAQEAKIKKLKAERDKAVSRVSQLENFIVSVGQDIPPEICSSLA